MTISPHFIIQQQNSAEEQHEFLIALMETGKCELHLPPDCFMWTGTKAELDAFMAEHSSPVPTSDPDVDANDL